MAKRFILCIEYGTGKAGMLVDTPDITEALQEFLKEYRKGLPDTKDVGLPNILKAEIVPLLYESTLK